MSGQNIHIMNIIKCFVVCQQILLIYTKCTLSSYTDQTSDSASFGILSVEGVNHICRTHIIYINTYIHFCLDSIPYINISRPFSTNHITRIFHFIQHITCQRICIRNSITATIRILSLLSIIITKETSIIYHNIALCITNIHRINSSHNI